MKSAEILRPLTFARNYATIACRKSNLRRGKYGKKKRCSKVAVQYTFCDGKASVKVRTELEKMWYNMSAEKNGKNTKRQRQILLLRKREKVISCRQKGRNRQCFPDGILQRSLKRTGKRVRILRAKIPHKEVWDSERGKHAEKRC